MSASATTQSRDELTAWLDSHIGQTISAQVVVDDDRDFDHYFACDMLVVQGELQRGRDGRYRIGGSSILGTTGARGVQVSRRDLRKHGVDFVHVELGDGIILSISACGDGVTA
jgi:hypothetical protein